MAPSKGKILRRITYFLARSSISLGKKRGELIFALLFWFSDAEVRKKLLENLKKEVK